jgi:hypothetical protein
MTFTDDLKTRLAPLEKSKIIEMIWLSSKYKRFQRNNIQHPPLSGLLIKALELVKNRLKISRTDNSFANEFRTVRSILGKIELKNHYLVDIGAADGIHQSSTSKLLDTKEWCGTLYEIDSDSFSKLAFLYNNRTDVNLGRVKVNPENVVNLLDSFNVPRNFDYLNIDIDSYDLSVLRALIGADFRPGLISMEINEIFPPNVEFEVLYDSNFTWNQDKFFGCSLRSAEEALKAHGYFLTCVEYNNAFFVDASRGNREVAQPDIYSAYRDGYSSRKQRLELFPWNEGIEITIDMTHDEIIEKVNRMFAKHSGKYHLAIPQDEPN